MIFQKFVHLYTHIISYSIHIRNISVSMQHRLLVRSRWFYSWEHYCCEFDLFWDIQRCELSRETFSSWSHFQWVVNRAVSTSYYVVYYLLANRMVCTVSLLDTLFFNRRQITTLYFFSIKFNGVAILVDKHGFLLLHVKKMYPIGRSV